MSQQAADALMGIFGMTRVTCSTCANSHPSQAYPQLACMFRNEFVSPNDQCVRWVKK